MGVAERFRARRNRALKQRIEVMAAERGGRLSVIDLGGSAGYWAALGFDWMRSHGVRVTCINYEPRELTRNSPGNDLMELRQGNACNVDAPDNSFDFVHSNSVIEHVGRWSDMAAFAGEVRRLAPSYYVQTPYLWFPIDPHFFRVPFFHWLPVAVRARLVSRFKVGHATTRGDLAKAMRIVQSSDILDRAQFRTLFPDARHRFEMAGPLPKSMIAER